MSLCMATANGGRLPQWLRKGRGSSTDTHAVKKGLRCRGLHTVCEEARCPNIGECFSRKTATIMIMGGTCTRSCGFCAVKSGRPAPLDPDEPKRVAEQIREFGLRHAVVTSVTRDDLPDGGASHIASTVREIRARCPKTTIEVLTPDFEGRAEDIATVCAAQPDVFNHNVETVYRLTPCIRSRADYRRSLSVLKTARSLLTQGFVKSGLMVGLGEELTEIETTLNDLARCGCDVVTIGQYLPPSRDAVPVKEYIEPETFREYEALGLKAGLKHVFAGPLIRSSYLADKVLNELTEAT